MLYDQPFNAMRVRHHGLGEAIFPEKCSLDVVETSVRNTVDGKYSAEIKRMQSHFLAMEKEQPSHLLLSKWMTDAQSGRIAR
jgi:UDP:flavonoid glycosyltransferase YjiC (YdhE family)